MKEERPPGRQGARLGIEPGSAGSTAGGCRRSVEEVFDDGVADVDGAVLGQRFDETFSAGMPKVSRAWVTASTVSRSRSRPLRLLKAMSSSSPSISLLNTVRKNSSSRLSWLTKA